MVNSHLVCDPPIRQPGFDLPRQQWSLLNRFRMEQGHCGACRRKWRLTDTDLCPCGETQTMSHIIESCRLTKLNGDLSRYTLRMKTLFRGWPVTVRDTHTRRRRRLQCRVVSGHDLNPYTVDTYLAYNWCVLRLIKSVQSQKILINCVGNLN